MKVTKGFVQFRKLYNGESRWHVGADRCHDTWYIGIYAFGHLFQAIGPFEIGR